jgi:hypothetical protein
MLLECMINTRGILSLFFIARLIPYSDQPCPDGYNQDAPETLRLLDHDSTPLSPGRQDTLSIVIDALKIA